MLRLKLDRPLAILDIEATGLDPRADRIVELCIVRLAPDQSKAVHTFRFYPEMPIPPGATAIHGISDADVANCPTFEEAAPRTLDLLRDCDLVGFNLTNFDIPLLIEEFMRCKIQFDLDSRRVIDVQRIFHKKEPRDLVAALRFYCNETLHDAHGAEADALATLKVLEGQLERYPELPASVEDLDEYCNPREPGWLDRAGRLKWVNGEVTINFGRKTGSRLRDLIQHDLSYVKWILRGNFPNDTREIIRKALEGTYPPPPGPAQGMPGN